VGVGTIAIQNCLVTQIGPFHQFNRGGKKEKARDRRRQSEEKSDENKVRARERGRKREPLAHAQVACSGATSANTAGPLSLAHICTFTFSCLSLSVCPSLVYICTFM